MKPGHRIREAEARLFARGGLQPEQSFLSLDAARVRLRVLSVGTGPPLVMRQARDRPLHRDRIGTGN
jgi:hypothetical protein